MFLLETLDPLCVFERKTKELANLKFTKQIIDSVHDGIYIADERGFTLHVNNRYSEITGIKNEEVQGLHVCELVNRKYFDSTITLKVIKEKKRVSILQKIKNGHRLRTVTGNPICDEQGNLMIVVNTVHDMTELNRLRESLKEQEITNTKQKIELQILRSQMAEVPELVGNSAAIGSVKMKIKKISEIDSTVLILGETGCGKNVVARAIHKLSDRASKPFIEVNCGSIPEHLIESELFGYANGAFTGATRGGKPGLLEVARHGTIFLDEIGDMPYHLQVKLLTFLQDKKIRRVGDTASIEVDVRVIAATHKNLKQLVDEGKFREDLYYRLSVVPIHLPALRDNKDDIYVLTEHFLKKYSNKYKRSIQLSKAGYLALESYSWPGNVREFQHLIEQLVVLTEGNMIEVHDLPEHIHSKSLLRSTNAVKLDEIVQNIEFQVIKEAWEQLGDVNLVADRLGIHRTTLVRKAIKLGLNLNKKGKPTSTL
ncbi:hypothetical protein BIV59_06440 [Bacillus sp. MUM 13]|nr:hypothetical protein BIV59_06440 [Bacillus sp. MUM 13]